jgi:methionine-rich copper-binding protein CopC
MKKMIAFATAALALAAATEAAAHARLVASEPRREAVVSAPKALRLTFSEKIVPGHSSVAVTGAHGPVAAGPIAIDRKNPHLVVVPLPALAAGDYRVKWTMTTEDTHTMSGDFPFRVK